MLARAGMSHHHRQTPAERCNIKMFRHHFLRGCRPVTCRVVSAPLAPLVTAFLSGRASAPTDTARFAQRLEAQLEDAVREQSISRLELATALGQRALPGEASASLEALHPRDVALTLLVARGDRSATLAFERALVAEVRAAIAKIDASEAFADEVTQELRQRLLVAEPGKSPRLLEYSGRGPLTKWLKISAVRTALALRRGVRHGRSESDEALLDIAAPGNSPEFDVIHGRYREPLRDAFTAAFTALSSHERNLLRLHYLEGVTLAQIGCQYGLHRTTVARHLEQARLVLFDGMRQGAAQQLKLSREEFEQLIALLRSQLDVSIRRLLHQTRR